MSRMTRSAHGLALPRDEDWRLHGLCSEYPDMWCSPVGDMVAMALHLCIEHCPVKRQCAREGEATPPDRRRGVIYGGVRYIDQNGAKDVDTYRLHRSCARCRDGH